VAQWGMGGSRGGVSEESATARVVDRYLIQHFFGALSFVFCSSVLLFFCLSVSLTHTHSLSQVPSRPSSSGPSIVEGTVVGIDTGAVGHGVDQFRGERRRGQVARVVAMPGHDEKCAVHIGGHVVVAIV
jgi:hypothetical protein